MKKKKKDNKKTLSTFCSFTKEQTSIFRFLTNESKKIYNHYMFYLNIYNYYKNHVYNDIFIMHTDKKITNDNIDEHVVNRFKYYSLIYINNYEQFKINNKLIYNIIKNMNLIITDTNYYQSYLQIINKCLLNKDIIFNNSNCDFLFYDIIKNILTTFYINNFYSVRYQLLNNIPIKEHLNIASFIEHVKLGQLRYSNNILLTPKYYTVLSEIYDINSEQTIIRKFALYNLNDCKIYKDTVINIMDSVYDSYKSFLALKFSGKYANKPKFKLDNEKYILPLYSKSFTIIKNRIRICLGNYVDRHYNEICKTEYKIIKQNKIYIMQDNFNIHEWQLKQALKELNEEKQCPDCGSKVSIDEEMCGECGYNMGGMEEATFTDKHDDNPKLKGGQKELDKDNDGELTATDFAILRGDHGQEHTNESACNMTAEGVYCPEHGMNECGMMYESKDEKADQDYDEDGKIETGAEEHAGSVDKAIKKAKGEEAEEKLDECGMMGGMPGDMGQESGMSINSSVDTKTGRKTLSVTADGDSAAELAKILKMAGVVGHGGEDHKHPGSIEVHGSMDASGAEELAHDLRSAAGVDEEYANQPDERVAPVSAAVPSGNDLHKSKTQYKHSYKQSDNPMAMHEDVPIEQRLLDIYQKIKLRS